MDKRIGRCKDCNKKISLGSKSGRCQSCSNKGKRNHFYGKRHTKKTKNKLSKSHKGIFEGKNNPNYKDGKTLKPNFCIDCSKKIKYSATRCGSCSQKGKKTSAYNPERHKKHYCKICKKEISYSGWKYKLKRCPSCAQKERFKDPKKHYNYIDGRGYDPYPREFIKIREEIRERDNYQCQNLDCKMTEEEHLIIYDRTLEVHHIDYNKDNCKKNNLISLCKQCNTRANANRDYWFAYFTYIMELIYE